MKKPKKTTSFASWQLSTGKAGDVFYSEKENKYITGLAVYHNRKVKTERTYCSVHHCNQTSNVVALGAVAVFGAQNCQHTTKADARHKAQLSTSPAIEPNACYMPPFLRLKIIFDFVCKFKNLM